MTVEQLSQAATFAAVWITLMAAHGIADHVVQTDTQATGKTSDAPRTHGISRRRSIQLCLAHVASYHVTLAVLLAVVWWALALPLTVAGVTAGLAFSALTHGVIDRRWPVRWLLEHTGSSGFARLADAGINGMYLTDQALHGVAIWIAALIMAAASG